MPTSGRRRDAKSDAPAVRIHELGPDRAVFAEEDNTDAWISTDLTVEPSE